jgi:uncharacterized membrane protein
MEVVMDELEKQVEEKAKVLKEKLGEKKKKESEQQTKERMKSVLSERDAALQAVYDYQDKTGVPTEEETAKNFFEIETNQKD